jgi:Zn finger protein HypA/HybF involved in hydrogenase expression
MNKLKYDVEKQTFLKYVNDSTYFYEFLLKLGYCDKVSAATYNNIFFKAKEYGISMNKFKMVHYNSRFHNISDEEFKNIVLSKKGITKVVNALGYNRTSGSMNKIVKARALKLGLTILEPEKRNYKGHAIYSLDDLLIENSPYSSRARLKIRLIRSGKLKNECTECGQKPLWNDKHLTLELDHINGIYNDNRIENLRILCPNCHSQTPTSCGKKQKENKIALFQK